MSQIFIKIEHLAEEIEKFAEMHLIEQPYTVVKNMIESLKMAIISRDSKNSDTVPPVASEVVAPLPEKME